MALKALKKVELKDKDISKFQENISLFLAQLNSLVLNGAFLQKTIDSEPVDITIGTTTTLVKHGLGRSFLGWHVLDIQGDARVWRDTGSSADLEKYLPLKASASVKVKLWVF